MAQEPLLQVRGISKVFGATHALSDVSMEVRSGEIHSLLGRNGAGKSTLVNIIAGIYPPTEGDVLLDGNDIRSLNIFERQELGIRLVPQHENSFPDLTVAENVSAGALPTRRGFVDWRTVRARAADELAAYGLDVSVDALVQDLSSIDARKLNIIKAIHSGARLIILDEPTTALTNRERADLFGFVRTLSSSGTAFIFISHYLGEVQELSHGISVLRDGRLYPVEDDQRTSEAHLAALVAGESVDLTQRSPESAPGPDAVLVDVANVTGDLLDDVTLTVRRGEVLGVVGFPGSGAREFCRTLFGLNPIRSGRISMGGVRLEVRSPREGLSHGIAYISFDRHREGILHTLDLKENVGISAQAGKLARSFGFVNLSLQRALAEKYRDLLRIKCASVDVELDTLSGGNQQKVLISRLLNTDPTLLVLDEPTVGIDIKSREEIISTVLELTRSGMSAIYLTNDYEELLRVADRLVFFDQGRVIALLENQNLTIDELTAIRDREKEMD